MKFAFVVFWLLASGIFSYLLIIDQTSVMADIDFWGSIIMLNLVGKDLDR